MSIEVLFPKNSPFKRTAGHNDNLTMSLYKSGLGHYRRFALYTVRKDTISYYCLSMVLTF